MSSLSESLDNSTSKKSLGLAIGGHRGLSILQNLIKSSDYRISWILIPDTLESVPESLALLPSPIKPFRINKSVELENISQKITSVDILICAGFPFKLPKSILNKVSTIGINCHGGKLPSYRGGSPIMWQIINDEEFITLTIHELSSEFDEGDILLESSLLNDKALYIREVQEIVNQEFVRMLDIFLKNPEQYIAKKRAQDSSKARYWHQRRDVDGFIDWQRMNASKIYNFVRALATPYPGARSVLCDGELLRIWQVEKDEVPICGSPGRIVKLSDGLHVTTCDDSSIRLVKFGCSRKIRNGEYMFNHKVGVL